MSYALAVLILLLATGLRLWDLTTVPIGLHTEEVLTLRLSDSIRAGDIRVFYPVGNGDAREILYYTALAFTRLGTGTGSVGYRIISVLANIVMLTSALLKHGVEHLETVRAEIVDWMSYNEYWSLRQLRGQLRRSTCRTPEVFERANYASTLASYVDVGPVQK